MQTKSIYTNNEIKSRGRTPKEIVARLAMEQQKIEDLQKLGFTHSNGQEFESRYRELGELIQQFAPSQLRKEHHA